MQLTNIVIIVILASPLFNISRYSSAFYEMNSEVIEQSKNSDASSKYDPRAPRYSLSILKPISLAEFLSYTETLKLDEPQRVFSELLFEEYRDKDRILRAELCIPLWQRSAELLSSRKDLGELPHAEAHAELLKDGRKAQRQLVQLENELFAECENFLQEDQLPLLEQVRLQRSRNQMRGFGGIFRVDQVDLILLMRNLPGLQDMDESKKEALSEILLEYDREITPLWKQRHEAALKAVLRIPILKAPLYALSSRSPLEPMEQDELASLDQEILKKVGRLNRAHIRPGKRILDLNQQYLKRLNNVLPKTSWNALQQRYNAKAYYPIFPNPFDANYIFTGALELADLSVGQRSVLMTLAITYASSTLQIEDKMKDQYVAMHEVLAEYQRKGEQFKSHQEELRKLDVKRQEIAENTIAQLKDVLLQEQLMQMAILLDEHQKRITIATQNRDRRLFHS